MQQALDSLAISPGKRDRRIPGYSCGEAMGIDKGHFSEAPFNALVHIPQPFLEPQYFFADD